MVAALNKFINRSSDHCRPFFQLTKKNSRFEWTLECNLTLQELKAYLAKPPLFTSLDVGETLYVYLAVFDHVVSSTLIKDSSGGQTPVFYISKTLLDAKTRYFPVEKLLLALVVLSRKLWRYFLAHPIVVYLEFPLKIILHKPDLSGRISKWVVELGQYDI